MTIYWRDVRNFSSKLTLKKISNLIKVVAAYYLTRWRKKPIVWGLPFTISFEPTTACNLRCPECPSGLRQFSRPTGNLKQDFFRKVLDEAGDQLLYLIFYFQGEPYINPDFLEMVRYASEKGIYTISSTNGHFLNDENARKTVESGLDRLIISVDGTTQETYEQYRVGGKLATVLQGARNLVKWKRKLGGGPHLIFQFLVVRPNEHQIEEVKRLATEIGIDEVKFKTAQLYDYEQGNPLMPENLQFSRYRQLEDGRYTIKNPLLNHCWKLWHSCVITWDGLVAPCCFDKDVSQRLGDTKTESLRDIWYSPAYFDFRKKLLGGRASIDICTNCTEGCKVWLGAEV
ncbi:MAG: radical SAM/SPASM domain-containing protein [Bacteroidota bacterium]